MDNSWAEVINDMTQKEINKNTEAMPSSQRFGASIAPGVHPSQCKQIRLLAQALVMH